jgi:hypothetical protein
VALSPPAAKSSSDGGTSEIDGLLVNSGTVLANSGTLLVSGSVVNSGGTLFASGAGSLIDVFGVVTGGVTKIGNGVVDFEGSSGENVTFLANGSGGLVLADSVADPTAYVGRISGFGGANHANKVQFIDLASVTSDASVSVSYVPFASHTSGTLFVSRRRLDGRGNHLPRRRLRDLEFPHYFRRRRHRRDHRSAGRAGADGHRLRRRHDARLLAERWQNRRFVDSRARRPCRRDRAARQLHGGDFRDHRGCKRGDGGRWDAADGRAAAATYSPAPQLAGVPTCAIRNLCVAGGRRCACAADMAIARAPKYRCRNKIRRESPSTKMRGQGRDGPWLRYQRHMGS